MAWCYDIYLHDHFMIDQSQAKRLHEDKVAEDHSYVLLLCQDKHSSAASGLLFWLKLLGHEVIVVTSLDEAVESFKNERLTSAFIDIAQVKYFALNF